MVSARAAALAAEVDRLHVDLTTNTVTYREHVWRDVRPKLAEFLYALAHHYPHPVDRLELERMIWGLDCPHDDYFKPQRSLYTYACMARRMLEAKGFAIELSRTSTATFSYRLITPQH